MWRSCIFRDTVRETEFHSSSSPVCGSTSLRHYPRAIEVLQYRSVQIFRGRNGWSIQLRIFLPSIIVHWIRVRGDLVIYLLWWWCRLFVVGLLCLLTNAWNFVWWQPVRTICLGLSWCDDLESFPVSNFRSRLEKIAGRVCENSFFCPCVRRGWMAISLLSFALGPDGPYRPYVFIAAFLMWVTLIRSKIRGL